MLKKLDNNALENINGGVIRGSAVYLFKAEGLARTFESGYTLEDVLKDFYNAWKNDPYEFSTDGSKDDYNAIIQMINDGYNSWKAEKYK